MRNRRISLQVIHSCFLIVVLLSSCQQCDKPLDKNAVFIQEIKEVENDKYTSPNTAIAGEHYFTSNHLYNYKILNFIPDIIIDTTFILFKNISSKDSINLNKLLNYNFSRVLEDTSYIILDSLIAKYPYDFPSGEFKNYFYNVRIQLSNDLEVSFVYTKGLKFMKRNYNFDDRPTIKKIKKESFNRFEIQFHNEIVFSCEKDIYGDSIVIYLPYEIKNFKLQQEAN